MWESRFQRFGNLLMELAPSPMEEGLIRSILHQGVLEHIANLWQPTALIQEFDFH
jgi:hypothetical protein